MRKLYTMIIMVLVLALALGACSGTNDAKEEGGEEISKKKVVATTTTFIEDMVKQIASDKVETSLIIPAGVDPHTYMAKPEDVDKINAADLVLYHGLHFEGKMVEMLEKVGSELARDFDEANIGSMPDGDSVIVDPHFWFDLGLYKQAVLAAKEDLIKLTPEYKEEYEANTKKYLERLDELDEYIKDKISQIPEESRYLITPHDAFSYFSRAYDIGVKAPQGVSTDSEVASADILETVDFIVEHDIKAVFAESTTDPVRMEKLREEVENRGGNVKVVKGEGQELFSDSLAPMGEFGDNFIDMYKHNVDLIYENLK